MIITYYFYLHWITVLDYINIAPSIVKPKKKLNNIEVAFHIFIQHFIAQYGGGKKKQEHLSHSHPPWKCLSIFQTVHFWADKSVSYADLHFFFYSWTRIKTQCQTPKAHWWDKGEYLTVRSSVCVYGSVFFLWEDIWAQMFIFCRSVRMARVFRFSALALLFLSAYCLADNQVRPIVQ